MESNQTWEKRISDIECHPNNVYNKTIGDTPFHVFEYYPSFRDDVLHHETTNDVWDSTVQI